jgi:hypothetical protein
MECNMSNEADEVERISKRLEQFVLDLHPKPALSALAVTCVHWAARCALADHRSEEEFLEGAKIAWRMAKADFGKAVPSLLAHNDRQS